MLHKDMIPNPDQDRLLIAIIIPTITELKNLGGDLNRDLND